MVRPISGQQRIQSGNEFTEDEGVTLRATRSSGGTAHTRGAQGARSGAAHGTVRDEIVQTPQATQTPGQAAVAARHAEIRSTANALLQQADATRPGPNLAIPAARNGSGFQELVNRQHDRAAHHGAVMTAGAIASVGVGHAAHHGGTHLAQHLQASGAATRNAGIVAGAAGGAAGHAAVGYAAGESREHIAGSTAIGTAVETTLGPLGTGLVVQGQALLNQHNDNNERIRFQQDASVYDAARATAITDANLALNHGVIDGHLAAAGRRPINWDMYRTNGDYASGVRRGLADGARNPGEVAHLTLQAPQEMRTSIP
jgi:hypothetical protein